MNCLFPFLGFAPIYILALIFVLCSILSVPIFVRRDRRYFHNKHGEQHQQLGGGMTAIVPWKKKLKKLFDPKNMVEALKSPMQDRDGSRKHLVLLLLLVFAILEFVINGERTADLLFVRYQFPWGTFEEFNHWWNSYYAVVVPWGLINLLVMVPVLKHVYHMSDPVIILACAVGSFLRCLVFILATQRGHLYIGGFLDLFELAGLVTCRYTYK